MVLWFNDTIFNLKCKTKGSLERAEYLILEQTQVNVREWHNVVRLKQRANNRTEKQVYIFVYILAYKR